MAQLTIQWSEAQELAKQQAEQEAKEAEEIQEMREEAHAEVLARVYSGDPFSYTDIEDIMLGYGFEMDGIEELF